MSNQQNTYTVYVVLECLENLFYHLGLKTPDPDLHPPAD